MRFKNDEIDDEPDGAMKPTRQELVAVARKIRAARYPSSKLLFLAGSLVRGEGTITSDLDLVVMYEQLDAAYRESFYHQKWPVEAFVHDPSTLDYFFRSVDRVNGVPSLPNMVAEGIEIPHPSAFGRRMKSLAESVIAEGPPAWSRRDSDLSRYMITDHIEDLRAPRSHHEAFATLSILYPALANHYFRSKGHWSAKGKTIPRALKSHDAAFAKRFLSAFDMALSSQEMSGVIEVAAEVLKSDGGFLFDGYTQHAPKEWRVHSAD
ncbi:MAG: nucleotidyltransferase domain-containing protein [Geminicoccaceae bacterium]